MIYSTFPDNILMITISIERITYNECDMFHNITTKFMMLNRIGCFFVVLFTIFS